MRASDFATMELPLVWATENLELIGRGECASVFVHPTRPDMVVRFSEDEDMYWWFAHCILDPEEEFRSIHAPIVHDLAVANGTYVGVIERLSPLQEQDMEIVRIVQDGGSPTASISRLISTCPVPTSDLRDENWMVRGSTLVLIDPCARLMPEWMWERFEEIYGVRAASSQEYVGRAAP